MHVYHTLTEAVQDLFTPAQGSGLLTEKRACRLVACKDSIIDLPRLAVTYRARPYVSETGPSASVRPQVHSKDDSCQT